MPKHPIAAPDAPPAGGAYSHAVATDHAIYLAGQAPFRPDGTKVEGSFEEQMRQTFANLEAVARAAGATLADAVRVGVFLRDIANFAEMDRLYRELMPEPFPARTTIQTALPGFEIEIDAVLVLDR